MPKLLKILISNDALPNPSVNRTGFRLNLLKLSLKLLLKFLFIKTYKIQTWIAFVVCMSCTWMNWTLKTLKRKKKKNKKLKRSQNNLRPTSACVTKISKRSLVGHWPDQSKKQTKSPNNDRPSNKKLFLRINLQGPNGYAVPIDSTRQLFFRFV